MVNQEQANLVDHPDSIIEELELLKAKLKKAETHKLFIDQEIGRAS